MLTKILKDVAASVGLTIGLAAIWRYSDNAALSQHS